MKYTCESIKTKSPIVADYGKKECITLQLGALAPVMLPDHDTIGDGFPHLLLNTN